jgi:alanine-alpha-ketoisovalerate/valine-pyruvate aminotransferase
MPFIRTRDGVDIFYKDWGPLDAQPIVFHHGWPLSARNVALTGGSQSAFFTLFNLLAGETDDGPDVFEMRPVA